MKMALVGTSILLMFGAVGAMDNGQDVTTSLAVVAVAAVLGLISLMVKE